MGKAVFLNLLRWVDCMKMQSLPLFSRALLFNRVFLYTSNVALSIGRGRKVMNAYS